MMFWVVLRNKVTQSDGSLMAREEALAGPFGRERTTRGQLGFSLTCCFQKVCILLSQLKQGLKTIVSIENYGKWP